MNLSASPYAEVLVKFFSAENSGETAPVLLDGREYRPHLRVMNDRELLEVEFADGPEWPVTPGLPVFARVFLRCFPDKPYEKVIKGARFEILERGRAVGEGLVIDR